MADSLAVKEISKMGKKGENLSALEVAVMGKHLASGGEITQLNMDARDSDWQVLVDQALSKREGSWFASKVDFRLNSAHFLGKVGYSVSGAVIPLFDGAALDVRGSQLIAQDKKKAEPDEQLGSPSLYENWVIGNNGLLVLAPVHADNVIPVPVHRVVITEKGLAAEGRKSMDFQVGNQSIHAESITFTDKMAALYGIQVQKDGKDESEKFLDEAWLDGEGIYLKENPDDNPDSAMPDREEGRFEQVIDGVFTLGKDEFGLLGDDLAKEKELSSVELEEEEDPIWTQLLKAAKKTAKKTFSDAVKEAVDTFSADAVAKVFTDKWEEIKAIYDGFSAQELRESWKEFPSQIKDVFLGKITDEKEIQNYLEKLLPTAQISSFLGMNENKETDSKEEKEGDHSITLAEIPIFFPFASFSVALEPGYSFSSYIRGGIQNIRQLWNTREGEEANLEFRAGIKGSLSIRAVAKLVAGVPLIIQGFASLYAKAGMEGNVVNPLGKSELMESSGENVMLELGVLIPVRRKQDGSIEQAKALTGVLEGGFLLTGSVGTEIGLESKLLLWKKNLVEKEFARWKLGSINARLGVKKEPTDSLLTGWELDDASIAVSGPSTGFGQAFLERNTVENRYGLYNLEERDSREYQQIEGSFEEALALLKEFAKVKETDPKSLLIPEGQEGGLASAVDAMTEIQNKFIVVWVDAQNELQEVQNDMEQMRASKKFQRELSSVTASKVRHQIGIDQMRQWGEEKGDILDYYSSYASDKGMGYIDSLEKEANEQATSYEAIVDYERKRYTEKTDPFTKRIELVQQLKQEGKTEEEIFGAYKAMGGGKITGHKAMFQDVSSIINYEGLMMAKESTKAVERLGKISNLSADNAEDKDFFNSYADMLSQEDLLQYGDRDFLLAFEKKKMEGSYNQEESFWERSSTKQHRKDVGDLYAVEERKKEAEDRQEEAASADFLENIQESELYRTASIDDLIELEVQEYVKGELGKKLETYLAKSPAENASLTDVFGKSDKKTALNRFGSYLEDSEAARLVPYLTIELLLDYVRRPRKTEKGNESAARELQFLNAGIVKVKASKPEDARQVEEEYIAKYFKTFPIGEALYKRALSEGEVVNLPMMMSAFSDESGNARLEQLKKAKEDKEPAFAVLKKYLEIGGNTKEINAHQKVKQKTSQMNIEDAHRFYEARVAESSSGHYERFYQMRNLYQSGASYEEMLKVYQSMGGGKEYSEQIKEEMKTGRINGKELDRIDALTREQKKKEQAVQRRQERVNLVEQMQEEGNDYQEILLAYENRVRNDGVGFTGKIKSRLNQSSLVQTTTGFEKSLSDEKITSDNMLQYEEYSRREAGKGHLSRLCFLLNLSEESDEVMTAPLITDEEEKREKREGYLNKAKRFKKSKEVQEATGRQLNVLLNRPDEEIRESVISYEQSQRDIDEAKLYDLNKQWIQLDEMKKRLNDTISICYQVTNNLKDIREHPGTIWNKIDEFEKSIGFLKSQEEKEAEIEQQKKAAIQEAAEQIQKALEEEEP